MTTYDECTNVCAQTRITKHTSAVVHCRLRDARTLARILEMQARRPERARWRQATASAQPRSAARVVRERHWCRAAAVASTRARCSPAAQDRSFRHLQCDPTNLHLECGLTRTLTAEMKVDMHRTKTLR